MIEWARGPDENLIYTVYHFIYPPICFFVLGNGTCLIALLKILESQSENDNTRLMTFYPSQYLS